MYAIAIAPLPQAFGGDRVYLNRLYLFREEIEIVEQKLQMQVMQLLME